MQRKRTVNRILNECYCRLAPSSIHGIGVFAVREIPKGTDPFRIGVAYPSGWIEITQAELDRASDGVRNLLALLFVRDKKGDLSIPAIGTNLVDISAYLNHSDRPNMKTADGHTFTAKRKIRKGEELTVDYSTYGACELLRARADSST